MDDLIKRLQSEIAAIMGPEGAGYSVEPVSVYMEAATALAEAQATIARLETALAAEREETLWNAYNAGYSADDKWDHCCMSDAEWLVTEVGLDVSQRVYSADKIKLLIPEAARIAALNAKAPGD